MKTFAPPLIATLTAGLCVSLLATCGSDDQPSGDPELSCEVTTLAWPEAPRALDLLLVIDDSASMADYQTGLAISLTRLAAILEDIQGSLPSLHIAVVSASASSGFAFQSEPRQAGCAAPDGDYLEHTEVRWWQCPDAPFDSCGEANFTGTLADEVSCLGTLGAEGGEDQQLLEAAVKALDGSVPSNDGFLRENANLGIVIVSDADDASPGAPADYAEALNALKPDHGEVVVVTVRSEPSPRLAELEAQLAQRSSTKLISNEDWSEAFGTLAILFREILGRPCLGTAADLTDVYPEEPGLQPECAVTGRDPTTGAEYVIPHCTMAGDQQPHPDTGMPCWWMDYADWSNECGYVPTVESTQPVFPIENWPEVRCVGICQ